MAIAEAEPKKSEVAVTSTGASQCVKTLDSLKTFSETKDLASSSKRKPIKTYDLYSNVKDFSFHMPDGWNDQDIGIFLDSCWENINGLRDPSIDENSKWQEIADAGAKKSLNPTLFTINSCMEVAQCIRQYVMRSIDNKKNEAFQKFCEDVKNLLKYFPPSPPEANRQRKKRGGHSTVLDVKGCERIFSDDTDEEQQLSASICKHVHAFEAADPDVWEDIEIEIEDKTKYDIDAKEYLELLKTNFISNIYEESDPKVRKDIFSKIRPYLLEIFDFVAPKSVRKSDVLNFVYGSGKVEESITSTNKEDTFVSRKRRPSLSRYSESENGVSSIDDSFKRDEVSQTSLDVSTVKKKRGRPKKIQRNPPFESIDKNKAQCISGHPSIEPSSTTLLDEGGNTENSLPQHQSVSSEKIVETQDEIMPTDEYFHETQEGEESVLATKRRGDRWKRVRPRPTRILPSREARNKVSSSISSKREKSHITRHLNHISNAIDLAEGIVDTDREAAKRSPNFRGFDDTDSDLASEEETNRKLRVVRKVTTTRRTFTRTTLPNPDTTTNDLDETESVSSPRNSTDDDMSYVRRLTRQTKESVIKENFVTEEKVENKVTTFVQADSTLNPVVKLHIMKESELKEGLRRKGLPNGYLSSIDEKGLTFSVPSAKPNIPVESAVLGKDVVKTVYNPNTDTAKTHAGPGSPTNNRRSGNRGRKGACPVPPKTRKGLKGTITHYNYYSDSDIHQRTAGRNCKLQGECSSTVVCLPNKGGQVPAIRDIVPESIGSSQPSGSSQRKPSKSSAPTEVVSENCSVSPLSNQISEMSEPSTSSSSGYNNELVLSLLNMLQDGKSQELSIPSLNPIQALQLFHSRPKWYEDFMSDFRRQQVWKMQQFVKMQQELVDLEKEKISLVKDLMKSLNEEE